MIMYYLLIRQEISRTTYEVYFGKNTGPISGSFYEPKERD